MWYFFKKEKVDRQRTSFQDIVNIEISREICRGGGCIKRGRARVELREVLVSFFFLSLSRIPLFLSLSIYLTQKNPPALTPSPSYYFSGLCSFFNFMSLCFCPLSFPFVLLNSCPPPVPRMSEGELQRALDRCLMIVFVSFQTNRDSRCLPPTQPPTTSVSTLYMLLCLCIFSPVSM